MNDAVQAAAEILRGARRVCVSTGAGMSAESGVATFRDSDGLWTRFNPAELATPEAFARDPVKVWEWYRARRKQLATIEPHEGHFVLARWERRFEQFTLITQNVDGLHERAGSTRLIELHGRLDRARCVSCEYEQVGLDDLGADPVCPKCGLRLRPGVVWFGEMLPPGAIDAAFEAAEDCDVLLVIGTSGVVQPAASLAEHASASGGRVIEINPTESELSYLAAVAIRQGSRDALTALDAALGGKADNPA